MIRSIRFTLTLWYIGILAATLCLFGGILYSSVKVTLSQDIEDHLASQADGVADRILTFFEARWKRTSSAPLRTLEKEIQEGHFKDLLARWIQQTGASEAVRPIRILDREGQPLYTSPGFSQYMIPVTGTAVIEGRARPGRFTRHSISQTTLSVSLLVPS